MVVADKTVAEILCTLYTPTLFLGKAHILCLLRGWVDPPSSSRVLCCGKRVWQKTLLEVDMFSTQRTTEALLRGSRQ